MGYGCCGKTFSCLFTFFNVIFATVGMATIGFGIFLKVHPPTAQLLNLVELDQGGHYLTNSAWIIIGFGALVLLVCFCGCVGAAARNRWLLGMYIIFSVIIVIGEVGAFVVTILFVVQSKDVKPFETALTTTLQTKYEKDRTMITLPWDYAQVTFECCGVSNYTDYAPVYMNETDGKVPVTCCVLKGDKNPEDPVPKDKKACMEDSKNMNGKSQFLNIKGCFTKLKDTVMQYSTVLLIVEAVIIAITIIGITIAACLCRTSDDEI
ncbi:CD82 antigen-like isoform X1 [Haliotis rufescens]|uniref:CD82 antigen-like isoform X1 n=1 Tax=Haliotis rufescens TaxID=6454 RepID=UPI00201F7989|nr:CD82 antigen-like isoform X1 [Haliotis rufescens]XP_048241671.1 CD82 antigen-like isoform X1 [Haliotis rufescens]